MATLFTECKKPNSPVWEYVVDDYLELQFQVPENIRKNLLGKLKGMGFSSSKVGTHACINLDGRIVIIAGKEKHHEFWFFSPKTGHLKKLS